MMGALPANARDLKGRLIVVVGPSGAGKDSVISGAIASLPDNHSVARVRRVITRAPDPNGEDHIPATSEQFANWKAGGHFAVTWQANGLFYGIPVSVRDDLAAGKTLVMNGSRSALPAIRAAFDCVSVAVVTASPEILAERLARRGRESVADILSRLERNAELGLPDADLVIDNSGSLEHSIRMLSNWLIDHPLVT